MKCKVTKPFDYAHNGVDVRRLAVGDEVEIRDKLVPGLQDSGHLAGGKTKAAKAAPAAESKSEEGDGSGDGSAATA